MKQTVEEAAKEYADNLYEPTDRGILYRETQKDFIAGVEWQAMQSPWISVNKRMPEDEQLVLTSSSIYGIKLLVWNDHYNVWDDEDGDDVYCERDKIDTWMPIPE